MPGHASHEDGSGEVDDERAEEAWVDMSDMLEVPSTGLVLGGGGEEDGSMRGMVLG